MKLSLIAAIDQNNLIGKDNKLIWHLPADLKFFKQTTQGHHIIMGRKNYESIGRPLSGRTSIVISRRENYSIEGCVLVSSIEEALAQAKNDSEPFVIGGGEIYALALPFVHKMYLTKVHAQFEGNVYFPQINYHEWNLIDEKHHKRDEKNKYPFTICIYERKI